MGYFFLLNLYFQENYEDGAHSIAKLNLDETKPGLDKIYKSLKKHANLEQNLFEHFETIVEEHSNDLLGENEYDNGNHIKGMVHKICGWAQNPLSAWLKHPIDTFHVCPNMVYAANYFALYGEKNRGSVTILCSQF